jgi:hypothetical protein
MNTHKNTKIIEQSRDDRFKSLYVLFMKKMERFFVMPLIHIFTQIDHFYTEGPILKRRKYHTAFFW